ncbi:MAG: DEAD/DEAH box helicase, partial [Bacteroidales bacterium]|nr:DEAD/DEAH box helicase [Bacteroidales bacterium]
MLDSGAFMEAVGAIGLPVTEVAGVVNDALREHSSLVVTAPPGAGKSTVLPLTILDGLNSIVPDSPGKVLMLEPRRLAAKQIAARMASIIGEPIGGTIGYRVRFDTKVSSRTRVEVLTEGILTRMLVADPTMDGVSVLIFDEFHERSLASDLSLALALECQKVLRPDLKIVIMSATIDTDEICSALKAPLVESKGRMFPVEIVHSRTEATPDKTPHTAAAASRSAHRDGRGLTGALRPVGSATRRSALPPSRPPTPASSSSP